ncbi:MAG: glycosyltransferase family 2 protein, partial [Candidatus Firestonebacteria bacterium]
MINRIEKKQYKLSIVVPAYNEEFNLASTIEAIFKANNKIGHLINILIVNDGSTDNTLQVADNLSLKYTNIKVLHHKFSKGLGTAFTTALILSEGDFFCLIPGDNQITQDYIYDL